MLKPLDVESPQCLPHMLLLNEGVARRMPHLSLNPTSGFSEFMMLNV